MDEGYLLNQEEHFQLHEDFFGKGSGGCEIDDTDLCVRVAEAAFVKVIEKLDPILLKSELCPFITLTDTKLTCWRMIPEDKWQAFVIKAEELKAKAAELKQKQKKGEG